MLFDNRLYRVNGVLDSGRQGFFTYLLSNWVKYSVHWFGGCGCCFGKFYKFYVVSLYLNCHCSL